MKIFMLIKYFLFSISIGSVMAATSVLDPAADAKAQINRERKKTII